VALAHYEAGTFSATVWFRLVGPFRRRALTDALNSTSKNVLMIIKAPARSFILLSLIVFLCLTTTSAIAQTLYGGLGGLNNGTSTNDGALGIVSQTTGAVTIVGQPAGVVRISGLAFDSAGNLFGSTLIPSGGFPPPSGPRTSNLITINPLTGALLTSNPITIGVGGPLLAIADLSVQPGTNTLFGVTNPDGPNGGPGDLYTINRTTGVATLVGNTGFFFNSIAFAPNGTLYLAAENLGMMGPDATTDQLDTINPATAASLTSVATADFFGALAVRPDGTIFGGNGDHAELFTINPTTGAETLIGSTGTNLIGDLAFQTPDTGTTLGLMLISLAGLAACANRLTRSKVSLATRS
jgi:hypothetical protein